MTGLRGCLAGFRVDLKGCLVAVLNDCFELFKGLFGQFLDDFMAIFLAFCGWFCGLIWDCLWHVQRIVLGTI